jgi:hypothetical protein
MELDSNATRGMKYTNLTTAELNIVSASYVFSARMYDEARKFSQLCYAPHTLSANANKDCYEYVSRQNISRSATCPFVTESCRTGNTQTDSVYIDSNDDLGINAPARDRIQVRKVSTCAIIAAGDRYSSAWLPGDSVPQAYSFPTDPTIARSDLQYKFFYLGSSISADIQRNFTFFVANFSSPANSYKTLLELTLSFDDSFLTHTSK